MLIRGAEIQGRIADLRIAGATIQRIAAQLAPLPGEAVIQGGGGALLPGLKDHHLHLVALAAAMESLPCGPPQVENAGQLAAALQAAGGQDWLRGIGYHESVAGDIDRHWLDRRGPARPLRIQHRSGRLWILNTAALERLGPLEDSPLERIDGALTGRLYDADDWLRQRLNRPRPDLAAASRRLAARGITGLTDTTPHNGIGHYEWFCQASASGEVLQDLQVMGDASLDTVRDRARVRRGATKFHLHEAELPDYGALCEAIRASHRAGRPVAFHCVARVDLLFALAALAETGTRRGDRIEHAGVAPPETLPMLRERGLWVVSQPGFVAERGDAWLREVAPEDQPFLYRLRSLLDAGIPLAGSSDAPFGEPDPWRAMQAAVSRRTRAGAVVGAEESLSPEQALALFTAPLVNPGGPPACIAEGEPADLCLLDRPWSQARQDLAAVQVRATIREGEIIAGAPRD